jgi:hypothetical protein
MASCKWCKKSGIFLSVDNRGLCKKCAAAISFDLQQRSRVIASSLQIINDGKKFKTRYERCDLVLEHAYQLEKYEKSGISVSETLPSKLILDLDELKDELLNEEIESIAKASISRSEQAASIKGRISLYNKGILKLEDLKDFVGDYESISSAIEHLRKKSKEFQLNSFLENARKFEFKGQTKKAIDQYWEALYFLKNDEIDDRQQMDQIRDLEEKIRILKRIE